MLLKVSSFQLSFDWDGRKCLPLSRAAEDQDELEEERRLAYVGIRVQKILYLTNANSRLLFGRTNYNQPTRFINEISSDLLEYQGLARPANSSF